jgi:hypothetical protein
MGPFGAACEYTVLGSIPNIFAASFAPIIIYSFTSNSSAKSSTFHATTSSAG